MNLTVWLIARSAVYLDFTIKLMQLFTRQAKVQIGKSTFSIITWKL